MDFPKWPIPRKHRDVTIIDLNESCSLVIACDSAGGIGPKAGDTIKVSGYILGRLTSRVALMEVLAVGAWPICVINTLSVEPFPTGREITLGVNDEISVLGIDPEQILTGSTEKNIPTIQSGIGITVVGLVEKTSLRACCPEKGDVFVLLGLPKVGNEVVLDDYETVDLLTVQNLLTSNMIKEIIPVGSRGVKAEVEMLIGLYNIEFAWEDYLNGLDINKSAGPATCIIVVGNLNVINKISIQVEKPITLLGAVI